MKETMKIQLAWRIIEFLEKVADLILEHYIDDYFDSDLMEESKNENSRTD